MCCFLVKFSTKLLDTSSGNRDKLKLSLLKKVSEYGQEVSQSYIADQYIWYCEEEPQNTNSHKTSGSH